MATLTLTIPDALYARAAELFDRHHTTFERVALKAIRDRVKRAAKLEGLGYGACPACGGLAVEDDRELYLCIECGARVGPEMAVRTGADLERAEQRQRVCAQCGARFESPQRNRRFCSTRCQVAHFRARQKMEASHADAN